MNQRELALQAQIEKLQAQNELMRKLSTKKGFCQYYFDVLPDFKFCNEAFDHVNSLYLELFGENRYSDFVSFRQAIHWFKKN